MKIKAILILASVLVIVDVLFALLPKRTANRIALKRGDQAVPTLQAFDAGSEEFRKHVPYEKSCSAFAGHLAIFCGEGYAFEQSRTALLQSSDSAGEIYQRLRGRWVDERPNLVGVYDVAFGLGLAEAGRAPEELLKIQRAIPPVLFTYLVDGWALRYAAGHSAREALQVCDQVFGFAFNSICNFGIGRGVFFYPEIKNDVPKEADTSIGYDFASTFTKEPLAPDEIRKLNSQAHKVIEVLKYKVDEHPLDDRDFKPIYECLAREHVSVCMTQSLP